MDKNFGTKIATPLDIKLSLVQNSQHSTAQHSTAQHSTAQHSTSYNFTRNNISGYLYFKSNNSIFSNWKTARIRRQNVSSYLGFSYFKHLFGGIK